MDEKLRTSRIEKNGEFRDGDSRSEYERDYGRLIHSPAFRRLQGKSQVFGAGSGDYYRTRLTHSLEVAQIARQVATRLYEETSELESPAFRIEPSVVECASLAHDLGHPPFGHKGEEVLNKLLVDEGQQRFGYEGNAQNFRILMFLEKRAGTDYGLNLTKAVLLGINKYPYRLGVNKKGLYSWEWEQILKVREEWGIPGDVRTLEAQLMDLCDDIAYSTHDLEDGIRAGKILMWELDDPHENEKLTNQLLEEMAKETAKDPDTWAGVDVKAAIASALSHLSQQWRDVHRLNDSSRSRRELKASLVNLFATKIGIVGDMVDGRDWKKVTFVDDSGQEDHDLKRLVTILKKLAWVNMVNDIRVQRLQMRSERIIKGLWDAFNSTKIEKSKIFPSDWINKYTQYKDAWPQPRFVADYIAGMTDQYAEKVYGEFFGGRTGSIYERD